MIKTATIGFDYIAKTFQLSDGLVVNCHIIDTGGQERYFAMNESYYKKADAVLLVYDITDHKSFEAIKNYYLIKIKELCILNIPIILLGNKIDVKDMRR